MALLAEEIVEEWLNRQGYFTIRGIRSGVQEIDLLAVKINAAGIERRHVEVHCSMRPVSYVTKVPKSVQKATGRKGASAKTRGPDELRQGVREWILKKYEMKVKRDLMQQLCPGEWTRELVINKAKHPEEVTEIEGQGVSIHYLVDIVRQMTAGHFIIDRAVSGDFVDMVNLTEEEDRA